eukprot:scaffold219175_cov35-Tisochrysis_lutea.AAC.2
MPTELRNACQMTKICVVSRKMRKSGPSRHARSTINVVRWTCGALRELRTFRRSPIVVSKVDASCSVLDLTNEAPKQHVARRIGPMTASNHSFVSRAANAYKTHMGTRTSRRTHHDASITPSKME